MAEQLVNDQLMFHVLQRAMSEVVRSQADGVLTDEVVEQLLDTTYAAWTHTMFHPLHFLIFCCVVQIGCGMCRPSDGGREDCGNAAAKRPTHTSPFTEHYITGLLMLSAAAVLLLLGLVHTRRSLWRKASSCTSGTIVWRQKPQYG